MALETLVRHSPPLSPRISWLREKRNVAALVFSWIREAIPTLLRRARLVEPGRWFFMLFSLLLLGFAIALLYQPAVGRGGR